MTDRRVSSSFTETAQDSEGVGLESVLAANLFRPVEQRLRILAHQGAQGDYPSNSLTAISAAFGVAEAVEFDVYALPHEDGSGAFEMVAHHPESYFLYVNAEGMKNTDQLPLTLTQARAIEVRGQQLIPTLDEVFQSYVERTRLTGKKTEIQIELKGPGTAEAIMPVLDRWIAQGDLSYDDFLLTALCLPGDRSRLEIARALNPRVRLVLVLRGGDFSQDAFANLPEAIEFAKEISASAITITRRNLTLDVVRQVHEAGFLSGCFHARTMDELEAALAWQVDYVAADDFRGSAYTDYPDSRPKGSPVFFELQESGFYQLRDWLWELGWKCEKQRLGLPTVETSTQLEVTGEFQAAIKHSTAGSLVMQLCRQDAKSEAVVDFSCVKIPDAYLGACERNGSGEQLLMSDLLSDESIVNNVKKLSAAVLSTRNWSTQGGERFLCGLDLGTVIRLSEGDLSFLNGTEEFLDHEQLSIVANVAREVLTRQGRLIGMAAFTALTPRHGAREEYKVSVQSELLVNSKWAQRAAVEQVTAQGLRSGKRCTLVVQS